MSDLPTSDASDPSAPPGEGVASAPAEAPEANFAPAAPTRRRWRRIAVAAGFIVTAIGAACILIGLALTQEDPRWWQAVDPTNPATIETAERVENGIASALTQVRSASSGRVGDAAADPAAPWKVFITTEQANAWLTVRLRRWLADQAEQGAMNFRWPPQVSDVQVDFTGGRINIGARVLANRSRADAPSPGRRGRPQTFAAALRPEFRPDGSLWLVAERVQIGRLSLPAGWVLGSSGGAQERVGEVSGELADLPQTQQVLAAMKGERAVLKRPVIKLADGRRVRLLAIEPIDGRVVVTCQTESAVPR